MWPEGFLTPPYLIIPLFLINGEKRSPERANNTQISWPSALATRPCHFLLTFSQMVVGKEEVKLEWCCLFAVCQAAVITHGGQGEKINLGLSWSFTLLILLHHASWSWLHKDNWAFAALKYRGKSLIYICFYIWMRNTYLDLQRNFLVYFNKAFLERFAIADHLLPCTHAAFM